MLPRVQRTGLRLRRRRGVDARGARRRFLGDQRSEDVHDARARVRLRLLVDPHRSGGAEAPWPDDVPRPDGDPGIELTPIHTLGGERTNVTFYTDVRVPDSCRVGEIDGGWDVMGIALAFERNPSMVGELDRMIRQFVEWGNGDPRRLEQPATERAWPVPWPISKSVGAWRGA